MEKPHLAEINIFRNNVDVKKKFFDDRSCFGP